MTTPAARPTAGGDEGDARAHEVTFRHADALLAGTLTVPAGVRRPPGLVMIHGSGATDRTNLGFFPPIRDRFVASGIAVLCYDKPGTGRSTGDWTGQRFPEDRVGEALAALRFLASRDDLDAGRLGLWGVSQGGWVVPLAASRSDLVSFAVVIAAPGVSPREQNVFDAQTRMRRDGHGEDVVAAAGAFVEALMAAAQQSWPYEQVRDRLLEPARQEPWSASLTIDSAESWRFLMRSDSSYDPTVALARLGCPLLAIWGADDRLVPVATSVAAFERALRAAGNERAQTRVFPGADHQVCVAGGAFAPGYLELMGDWVAGVTARP